MADHLHDEREDEARLIECELIERELARKSLKHFVARFTPKFKPGWHVDEICAALELMERQVVRGTGTNARLILEAPPRHGKSVITSFCFPLWLLGRHPDMEVIVATYAQTLADDIGRWAKARVDDPAFKAVFPDLKIRSDSKAADRLQTTKGGAIRYVGRGTGLTGKGGACIAAGSEVLTLERGPAPIQHVRVGEHVFTHQKRWRRVTHVHDNGDRAVIARTGSGGSFIVCTADHQVYTPAGWQPAGQAGVIYGYPHAPHHMPVVRQGVYRSLDGVEAQASSEVLFDGVPVGAHAPLGRGDEAEVPALRGADTGAGTQGPQEEVLLEGVLRSVRQGDRFPQDAQGDHLPGVREGVRADEPHDRLLLAGVQQQGPQQAHGDGGEREPQRRQVEGSLPPPVQAQAVPADARTPAYVHGVRCGTVAGCASHRRDEDPRHTGESDLALSWVPYEVPQVEECGVARVYDLTVDEDSSFVCRSACGSPWLVVHNCIICDDLLKDDEEATSDAIMEAAWAWYTSVLRTRLAPGGGIVVMGTRWAARDITGRLLEAEENGGEKWRKLKFSMEAKANDPWGREEGEPLHPGRFSKEEMDAIKRGFMATNPRHWFALYQQEPMIESGNLFKRDHFTLYKPGEEPKQNKRYTYITCDLAVSTKTTADFSAIMPVHLDAHGHFWFAPDFTKAKIDSDTTIETILDLAAKHKAHGIIIEGGAILRAIEPEIKRRMRARGEYYEILAPTPTKDKVTRSRPLHAMMQQGMIHWPDCPVFHELVLPDFLAFDGKGVTHDDIVDAAAWAAAINDKLLKPHADYQDDGPYHHNISTTPGEPEYGSRAALLDEQARQSNTDRKTGNPHAPKRLIGGGERRVSPGYRYA